MSPGTRKENELKPYSLCDGCDHTLSEHPWGECIHAEMNDATGPVYCMCMEFEQWY